MELTILTPTYNRRKNLEELFLSLEAQTSKEFEWLIIDDGSTDGTRETADNFIKNASFPVKYAYKENGGKHTALNAGIKQIETELTFIVDSDDKLTPDAAETVIQTHRQYCNNENLCGYSFLKIFPDGAINGKPFCRDGYIATFIESRLNSNDANSDKAEVFFTRVLKEYPFPEYPGEKFLGEDIVWLRMARKYQMAHFNKGIYIASYLQEGLTVNRRKHNIKSPVGCLNRAKEFLNPQINLKYRIKGALQYVIYGKFAGRRLYALLKEAPDKFLVGLCAIPALLIFKIWQKRYK